MSRARNTTKTEGYLISLDAGSTGKAEEFDPDDMIKDVTQQIIDDLNKFEESGDTPRWNKPWSGTGEYVIMGGKKHSITLNPYNIISPGRTYHFVFNWFILNFVRYSRKYKTNIWITPKRVKMLGATYKKSAYAVPILKFTNTGARVAQLLVHVEEIENFERSLGMKIVERKKTEESKKYNFARAKDFGKTFQKVLENKKLFIEGTDEAYYDFFSHTVHMPYEDAFDERAREDSKIENEAEANYWATFFHECIHWTGKKFKRFDAFLLSQFKKKNKDVRVHRAEEELVAELGSAFLCSYLGIHNKLQHPQYIKGWIDVLNSGGRNEYHPLLIAQQHANEAVKYLIDLVAEQKREDARRKKMKSGK